MWQVPGNRIDAGLFKPFEPVEVLYDFDGPRTFTLKDSVGQLCLAHWCDADGDFNRFIVVPFTEPLIQRLKAGEITLAGALDQPHVRVLDLAHSGEVREAWGVELSDLPADVLPKPGTMLWPSLEPMSVEPVIGSGKLTNGAMRVACVTPAQAYFGAAEVLMPGVRLLAAGGSDACVALTLLSGQMLECLLKAFLSKHGTPEKELMNSFGHDLNKLWLSASHDGLRIDVTPPQWVECLNGLYGRPYYLRYPMGLNGLVLPGPQPMVAELEQLLDAVRQGIG
jgi:hypothetical protein